MQPIDGRAPAIAVDEIVPVRDDIAQRARLMTERNAAIHAAGRLLLEHDLRLRDVDFVPVPDPLAPLPRTPARASRKRRWPRAPQCSRCPHPRAVPTRLVMWPVQHHASLVCHGSRRRARAAFGFASLKPR